MAYSPVIGFQATISVNDGGAGAQQDFSEPVMIGVPFGDVSIIDISNMSMASRNRRKIAGLYDPGNISFEGLFSSSDYLRLVALKGQLKVWVITAPDTGEGSGSVQWSCDAILTKCEMSMETEGLVKFKAEAAVSGDIATTTTGS
jgi:hypothetical protein